MRDLKQLTLATLAEIDGGRLAIAFEQALRRCAIDCDDRPGEKKARTVSMQISVEPRLDENGGALLFHPESLDDHEQHVLDFEDET